MAFHCPICRKVVANPPDAPSDAPPDDNTPAQAVDGKRPPASTFPFCSDRCRTIDLGRWLDEKYQVDVVEPDSDGEA